MRIYVCMSSLNHQEDSMSTRKNMTVTENATSFKVAVTHPCGHTFKSDCGWNSEAAARRHGRNLLSCVCGTCRSR